jgi:hypothetical protein
VHLSVYSTIMQTMRERWTDDRLDDAFDRVDGELRAIRTDMGSFRVAMKESLDRIEDRFDRMDDKFDRMDDKFDRWQRLMFSTLTGLAIALLVAVFNHM